MTDNFKEELVEERLNEIESKVYYIEDQLEEDFVNTHIQFMDEIDDIDKDISNLKLIIKLVSFVTIINLIINIIRYIRRKK